MKPQINVTPLIDVLLVLLIIFMVISPLKPSRFETRIPGDPEKPDAPPSPELLVVGISKNANLELNGLKAMGSVTDPLVLIDKLRFIFSERTKNGVVNQNLDDSLPLEDRIQKTVFIKAPKSVAYGDVVKVIDGVKRAGAYPISLQIDDLE